MGGHLSLAVTPPIELGSRVSHVFDEFGHLVKNYVRYVFRPTSLLKVRGDPQRGRDATSGKSGRGDGAYGGSLGSTQSVRDMGSTMLYLPNPSQRF